MRTALAQYPAVRINSPETAVPHILNLSVSGVKGTAFQQELGKHGVCVSVKSACSRISLSHLTTEAELEEFLQIFDRCYHDLTP